MNILALMLHPLNSNLIFYANVEKFPPKTRQHTNIQTTSNLLAIWTMLMLHIFRHCGDDSTPALRQNSNINIRLRNEHVAVISVCVCICASVQTHSWLSLVSCYGDLRCTAIIRFLFSWHEVKHKGKYMCGTTLVTSGNKIDGFRTMVLLMQMQM